ncbi:urea transporter [Accumulibacter sp.]|uniref:urea transporter n=1 Tax=Accumulibacter sp. TaxID=2053492 RepID=UPI0025DEBF10|nr:urea transporter [Accumulibacter sp.]MCM8594100.1 urea transporter [Accumulibacter sp.]MCM8624509.1 urea transporter [Accumulibacter sp.]MDS4048243.1 urea transporter [Accumulibacter sp.]
MRILLSLAAKLLDAYGALFLAKRRLIGTLVLAATLCDPATGSAGLIAGLAAMLARAVLRLPALPGEADVLNAIYAGLALGAFYAGEPRVLLLAALGGALAIPLGSALRQIFAGPLGARGLPLLGAPFLVTAWTLLAVAKGLSIPMRWQWASWPEGIPLAMASALSNVGALFYVAHPVAGALVLIALLMASRALALLALGGSVLAHVLIVLAVDVPPDGLLLLAAFNGALVAIFLGGVLSAPTLRTLLVAGSGVVVASALSAAMLALTAPFGIPALSAPFLLTVWLAHAALRPDTSAWWSRHWLPTPARPEDSLVAGRLAASRGLAAGSVGLLPPFAGEMSLAQGFDGELTHQGPWRYGMDFIRTENGYSYRSDGGSLQDFLAFDTPVLAPAWGTVVACRDDIADNAPGAMNMTENWGNYLLIDIGGGLCVMLGHLRQGSLTVAPGASVVPGMPLARCGNSGRSAQPHLHLHVQRGFWLGAATVPFHLSHALVDGHAYTLDACPAPDHSVELAVGSACLAAACAPRHGRVWNFAQRGDPWQLSAETGLLGITTLISQSGARLDAVSGPGLLALHGRSGAPDVVLDAFALAWGLTPFSPRAEGWRDAPDAALLPLPPWLRIGVLLRHPFGANLESRYARQWDAAKGLWRQTGRHRIDSLFGVILAESIGWLSEDHGPVAFALWVDDRLLVDATLAGYGNRGDHGVPAWSVSCSSLALS